MEFVRDNNGNVVGTALEPGVHPDTHEGAGYTHMIPVYGIPEGTYVGDRPDPAADAIALAQANARIAELERNNQARELEAANARIAELEARDRDKAAPHPNPSAVPPG